MKIDRKEELTGRVLEAIQTSGWQHRCSDPTAHPLKVRAISADGAVDLLVYIWNVTHGGKGRSISEYRIQITGVRSLDVDPEKFKTLLLGLYRENEHEVFVAFDPVYHKSFGASPSIQVGIDTVRKAMKTGVALQEKYKGSDVIEIVVAFTPEVFMDYVTGIFPNYHSSQIRSISEEEVLAITKTPEEMIRPPSLEVFPVERQRAVSTLNQIKRDASFRRRVLFAYHGRCAICGLQLRLVEASHIVPATIGSDETSNGLALCPNHHRAYDKGVIGINPDYKIILNEEKISELTDLGLRGGLKEFIDSSRVGKKTYLPADRSLWPKPEYLAEGLKLRGFSQQYF